MISWAIEMSVLCFTQLSSDPVGSFWKPEFALFLSWLCLSVSGVIPKGLQILPLHFSTLDALNKYF